MNTTRWKDLRKKDLNEVLKEIKSNDKKDLTSNRGNQGKTFFDFKVDVITKDIEKIKIFGEEIQYFSVNASYYLLKETSEERVLYNIMIIGYKKGNALYYIINRNFDASKNLRRILNITENNALEKKEVEITDYMVFWIIQRIFNNKNSLSYSDKDYNDIDITMNKMIGIKGSTSQENRLTVQGNTIVKLISTLSLLLEIDSFQEIKIELSMKEHEQITLALHKDGRVGTDINLYSGKFENERKDRKLTRLLLLLYLEVIPVIKSQYTDNEDNNNKETKEFISHISDTLIEKLDKIKI